MSDPVVPPRPTCLRRRDGIDKQLTGWTGGAAARLEVDSAVFNLRYRSSFEYLNDSNHCITHH